MTLQEAARILGLSLRTVERRVLLGTMQAERIGARGWLISRDEVEQWKAIGKLKPGRKRAAAQERPAQEEAT